MINNLNKALLAIGAHIEANKTTPVFSDYQLVYDRQIIGYGWKRESKNIPLGFMGWALPAIGGHEIVWDTTKNLEVSNLDFEKVINLFQFAVSEDYYWFSPPTNFQNAGYSCNALIDCGVLYDSINIFIQNNCRPEVFSELSYKWDWPQK
jgi:hypothetical protein